jgi:regulatory protein
VVITDIKKTKGKNYSVYVDDRIAFEVPEYILLKLDIHIGMELTEKELDLIKNQVLISMAKSDAVNFVSYKMRTTNEVETKLKEKYPVEVIAEAVEYLNQNDYLDDELYAEKFINFEKKGGIL